jgi:protoporphyrinogen oxidase
MWKADEDYLGKLASHDLELANLVKQDDILETSVYRVPKCYPVYKKGYKNHLKVVSDYFKSNHDRLIPIGRYGSFKYNNQDHSILMGDLAVKKILDDETIDLWDLNTDYTYQEASRITETGLVTE